jgi:hypothetical protein
MKLIGLLLALAGGVMVGYAIAYGDYSLWFYLGLGIMLIGAPVTIAGFSRGKKTP